jgi:hypothetical protein
VCSYSRLPNGRSIERPTYTTVWWSYKI